MVFRWPARPSLHALPPGPHPGALAFGLGDLWATLKLQDGVKLAAPEAVQVPQLNKPLKTEVSGAVAARVSGSVDASVDGEVDAEIAKPIQHERIRLGL